MRKKLTEGGKKYKHIKESPKRMCMESVCKMAWQERVPSGFWNKQDNVRQYMVWLGKRLGFKEYNDWYTIDAKTLRNNHGHSLLSRSSIIGILRNAFPEHDWKEWMLTRSSRSMWDDNEIVQRYMEWLGVILNCQDINDWYKVEAKDFQKHYGQTLLNKYKSVIFLLRSIYPQNEWLEWKFMKAPQGTWKDKERIVQYVQWLGAQQGYFKYEDWYNVSTSVFDNNYGGGLLKSVYNGSAFLLLQDVYQEYRWFEWMFKHTPTGTWCNKTTVMRYMSWLGNRIGVTELDEWYKVSKQVFNDNYGSGLISKFNGSPLALLSYVYPEHKWDRWRFSRVPNNTWNNLVHVKSFTEHLHIKLGFSSLDDWYNVTRNDFEINGGSNVLHYFDNSIVKLLQFVYAEKEWLEWLFNKSPQHFWTDDDSCRRYMQWLRGKMHYSTDEDWYQITADDFKMFNGGGILHAFKDSPILILKHVYPDNDWLEWKFSVAPKHTWSNVAVITKYMHWLGNVLGYISLDDWYSITQEDLKQHYGCGLLNAYGSLYVILKMVFPKHDWMIWRFSKSPPNIWEQKDILQAYMRWLGRMLGYETLEDWYNVSINDFVNNHAGVLCHNCGHSPIAILTMAFPHYEWIVWKFRKAPKGTWLSEDTLQKYMHWLGSKLGYNSLNDWYGVSVYDFQNNYGGGALAVHKNSPYLLLCRVFPHFNWESNKFRKQHSRMAMDWLLFMSQLWGVQIRHAMSPQGEYKVPGTRFKADGYNEKDNTIFEFHGDYWHGSLDMQQKYAYNPKLSARMRDRYDNTVKRRQTLESMGYRIVEVWESEWNNCIDSIVYLQRRWRLRQKRRSYVANTQ